jgi:Uma2 family endonuclease
MSTVSAPPPRELTPDDILGLSDDVLYELVDGQLVELNVSTESSLIAGNVAHLLKIHCNSPRIAHVLPEHGYTCFPGKPNRLRRPDVSLILAARMTPDLFKTGFLPIRPDLVIEVISPNDLVMDLEEKLDDYRDAGISLVWIIYPLTRKVRIIRPDRPTVDLGPDDELTGEDILPGFRCRIADLFVDLPAPQIGPPG